MEQTYTGYKWDIEYMPVTGEYVRAIFHPTKDVYFYYGDLRDDTSRLSFFIGDNRECYTLPSGLFRKVLQTALDFIAEKYNITIPKLELE